MNTEKKQERIRNKKMQELFNNSGFKSEIDFLAHVVTDSVAPGICMNADCNYTETVEPDREDGLCPECQENTVVSILVLKELI